MIDRSDSPPLGAHLSVAGGFDRALLAAESLGCQAVQIFSKNANQWRARPISADEAGRFRDERARLGIEHVVVHDSYLINLASPNEGLYRKSVEAFVDELRRAAQLGIAWVVTHPGAYTISTPEEGMARVAAAIGQTLEATCDAAVGVLLETTAGQGTSLGRTFEELAAILAAIGDSQRVGVCVDTCHLFAAGYPLASEAEYRHTFEQLDRAIGVERIRAFHLNDSKTPRGSRVDRHAHIGLGQMGLEPFRRLLNDPRFQSVPMILETEKGLHEGRHWDEINLETLRAMAPRKGRPTAAAKRTRGPGAP